jgi:hypothetical protein
MEEGYLGLTATVTTLTHANEVRLAYRRHRRPTINNLTTTATSTSRATAGTILDHELTIMADRYTPVDDSLIPTGEIATVRGTVMDFNRPTAIGARIKDVPGPAPGGYDHNYVLSHGGGVLAMSATAREPKSGRVMDVLTQVASSFTGFSTARSRQGRRRAIRSLRFCLETQHFPDSVNRPNFPPTILQADKTYKSTTVYRFSAKGRGSGLSEAAGRGGAPAFCLQPFFLLCPSTVFDSLLYFSWNGSCSPPWSERTMLNGLQRIVVLLLPVGQELVELPHLPVGRLLRCGREVLDGVRLERHPNREDGHLELRACRLLPERAGEDLRRDRPRPASSRRTGRPVPFSS